MRYSELKPSKEIPFADYPTKIVAEGHSVRVPEFRFNFSGGMGGKAEGLMYFRECLDRNRKVLSEHFTDTHFVCPKTSVVLTSCFDEFIGRNNLAKQIGAGMADSEVAAKFLSAEFSSAQREIFKKMLRYHVRPLIVRSSGLNEDAERASFAGIYSSVFLPNCHQSFDVRLMQFEAALKLVYASMFTEQARAYRGRVGVVGDGEKMAALVQNVVGRRWSDRKTGTLAYYPEISFAAFSHDDFAIGGSRGGDGMARLAFGLGPGVVEGEKAVCVNLGMPRTLNELLGNKQAASGAPRDFYYLDLCRDGQMPTGENFFLNKHPIIERADLSLVRRNFSQYNFHYDSVSHCCPDAGQAKEPGMVPKMLFHQFIKEGEISFVSAVRAILKSVLEPFFGCNIDFEGAADVAIDREGRRHLVMYILQARPQVRVDTGRVEKLPEVDGPSVVVRARHAVGKGRQLFSHFVYIPPEKFNYRSSASIAEEIGRINSSLSVFGTSRYFLGVPGRLGTSDEALGIQANFSNISNAGGVVEYPIRHDLAPDASQGTHFMEAIRSVGMAFISSERGGLNVENLRLLGTRVERDAWKYSEVYAFEKPLRLDIDKQGNAILYSG